MYHDGQDIHVQFFGQVECPFMKTFDHPVFRPGAFRKNNYRVAVPDPVFHEADVLFDLFRRKIICHADHFSKEW